MGSSEVLRTIIYGNIFLPALLFTAMYVAVLWGLRKSIEMIHLLIFTATMGFLAFDVWGAIVAGWWDYSGPRFLFAMTVLGVLIWQRVVLLAHRVVLPRLRRRRERRRAASGPLH